MRYRTFYFPCAFSYTTYRGYRDSMCIGFHDFVMRMILLLTLTMKGSTGNVFRVLALCEGNLSVLIKGAVGNANGGHNIPAIHICTIWKYIWVNRHMTVWFSFVWNCVKYIYFLDCNAIIIVIVNDIVIITVIVTHIPTVVGALWLQIMLVIDRSQDFFKPYTFIKANWWQSL